MNLQAIFKKALPHVVSMAIIIGCVTIYFAPQLSGKVVAGSDVVSSTAWSKQVLDYKEETGILSNWNPSMFSGMPWGLLTAGYQYNLIRSADKVLRLGVAPPMGLVIKSGIVCYIGLLLLGLGPWVSLFGALAFAFNVNYMILVEAGHQSKLSVIANFPLILSGLILCFRKKWTWGMPAIAFGTSIAIANNHIQMLYYLLLCFGVIGVVYFVDAIRKKELPTFIKMSSLALIAATIGALSNFSILTSAKSFAEDTMRGKPILEQASTAAPSSSSTNGLEWNYAMQWSNDSKDVLSVLVPRIVGGSSYEEVSADSETGRLLQQNNATKGKDNTYQAPMYWGGLPFTSGPYYSSIILFSVFVLGFFLIPVRLRWSLGLATLVVVLISMGKHASWLNKPLFEYLPLLNKFRAPSSAITILPLFMVFGAGLGLQSLVKSKKKSDLIKPILISSGGVAILSVLIALLGSSMLSFEGAGDARYAEQVQNIFINTRKDLFSSDAWRNVGLSILVLGLLWAYAKDYIKSGLILAGVLSALVFVDLYLVDQRHLDIDNWESQREYETNFTTRSADTQIKALEPKGRGYYRVFDIPNMRSAIGSYHHNTIGGYHAAKLQRYQDLLDFHITKGSRGALNMLNAKYTITQDQKVEVNQQALGNAWAVNEIRYVTTANEEIEAVGAIDPGATAIVNKKDFSEAVLKAGSGNCSIVMTDNVLNKWTYEFNGTSDEFIVFSEVWYDQVKGLTARIDGIEVDFVRVNYILRGLQVPSGKHTIEFEFTAPIQGAALSVIASILILLMLLYHLLNYFKVLPDALKVSFGEDDLIATSGPTKSSKNITKKKKKKS